MGTLDITGTGSELQGVGRLPDGRAVFVSFALPGERVEFEITREKERLAEARLVRVLVPSPDRQASDCPYYAACGGCDARHMRYEASLRLKTQRVRDALERIGRLPSPAVLDTLGMANPLRMRNKAEYRIRGQQIGCTARDGRSVTAVDDCLLQRAESVAAMRIARAWLAQGEAGPWTGFVTRVNRKGALHCVLCAEQPREAGLQALCKRLQDGIPGFDGLFVCRLRPRAAHALDGALTRVWGSARMTDTILDRTFSLSPQSFFQVNPEQTDVLYALVQKAAALSGRETVVDAYCGAGTIALCLAGRAARVVGVELSATAVRDARENAERNALSDRATFFEGDAARALPGLFDRLGPVDVLCVDPPRKGVDPALLQTLCDRRPDRVVYVSCDPATLARDLSTLCDRAYRLVSAQPVDMFPWTRHVETVASLERRT